jgi:hypothetical protein
MVYYRLFYLGGENENKIGGESGTREGREEVHFLDFDG